MNTTDTAARDIKVGDSILFHGTPATVTLVERRGRNVYIEFSEYEGHLDAMTRKPTETVPVTAPPMPPIVQIIGTKRLHKGACPYVGMRAYRTPDRMTDAELATATKATCCRPIAADALIGGAALRLADADGTTPPALARVSPPTHVAVDGVVVAETRRVDFPTMVPGAEPSQGTGELAGGDVQPLPPRRTSRRRSSKKDGGVARAAEVEARRAGLAPEAVAALHSAEVNGGIVALTGPNSVTTPGPRQASTAALIRDALAMHRVRSKVAANDAGVVYGIEAVIVRPGRETLRPRRAHGEHAQLAADIAAALKPAPKAAAAAAPKAERTFEGGDTHTCRTCGSEKAATSFPTVGGGRRGTECRACRDARRAARKGEA